MHFHLSQIQVANKIIIVVLVFFDKYICHQFFQFPENQNLINAQGQLENESVQNYQ
jgi:hypothetical protein